MVLILKNGEIVTIHRQSFQDHIQINTISIRKEINCTFYKKILLGEQKELEKNSQKELHQLYDKNLFVNLIFLEKLLNSYHFQNPKSLKSSSF